MPSVFQEDNSHQHGAWIGGNGPDERLWGMNLGSGNGLKKGPLNQLLKKYNQQTLVISCTWNVHGVAKDAFDVSFVTN